MSKFTKLKSKLKTIPSVKQFLKSLRPADRLALISTFVAMVSCISAFVKISQLSFPSSHSSILILITVAAYFFGITVGLIGADEGSNKERDNANNGNR